MDSLKDLHSLLRWAVVLMAFYTLIRSFIGMSSKSSFSKTDNLSQVIYVSLVDVQVLIGLILYFTSSIGFRNISLMGMKEVMHDGFFRFFAIEHITGMLLAFILLHIGRAKCKRALNGPAKFKTFFIWNLIVILIMLATIPWPFRKGFEALGWF